MRPVPKGFPPNSGRFGPCCRRLSPVWPATIPRPLGHSAPQPLYIYSFLAQLGRRRARPRGIGRKNSYPPLGLFRRASLARFLSSRTKDQNIGYIAEYLTAVGIDLKEVRVVGDEERAILDALNELRHRYTYVFTTGGNGPAHRAHNA